MARLSPSMIGGITGRVGNLVVYSRMGQYCVRRYVAHPRDARSDSQLRQRGVFRTLMALSADMQPVLCRAMRREAREAGLLASNLFMRLNARCCTAADEGGTAVDYSQLVVAMGPVSAPEVTGAAVEGLRLEVQYKRHGQAGSVHDADRIQVYAYCPDVRDGVLSLPAYRYGKRLAFVLPDEMAGHEVHVYAYCTAFDDDTLASPSVYMGCFTPTAEEADAPTDTVDSLEYTDNSGQLENLGYLENPKNTENPAGTAASGEDGNRKRASQQTWDTLSVTG